MEEKATVSQIGLRYGLITGLVLIVYSLILSLAGLVGNQALGWVSYLILLAGIILAHSAYKKGGDGYMSVGQGLGIGMIISLVGGVLNGVFTFIYIKFIDNSMLQTIKDQAMEKMQQKGMSDEQIDQAMKITGKFMTPPMILVWIIVGLLIAGFIISLIISLFTKKTNPQVQI